MTDGSNEAERKVGLVRRLNPTLMALLGGVAILLLILAYFATNRNSDQDKLIGNEVVTQTSNNTEQEKRCSSNATYSLIKHELFRRAAQIRGGDQAAYDQLAAYAAVRMENPVLEGEDRASGTMNCSASLSLDLPPGVMAQDGRHTLMADIDYAVDASGGVMLRNADAITGPLATLSRTVAPAPQPAATEEANAVAPEQPEANSTVVESNSLQTSSPH